MTLKLQKDKERLLLYVSPRIKELLAELAAAHEPPTSSTKLGEHLLEKALRDHQANMAKEPVTV